MTSIFHTGALSLFVAMGGSLAASAQTAPPPVQPVTNSPSEAGKASNGAPASLVVLFDVGSSKLRAQDRATLDRAARAYNEGKPIVMIVTGSSDRVGDAKQNLSLSQQRATAVLKGLLDRGLPAEHFQVLAKGETDLPVPTAAGIAEGRNRSVEISWH